LLSQTSLQTSTLHDRPAHEGASVTQLGMHARTPVYTHTHHSKALGAKLRRHDLHTQAFQQAYTASRARVRARAHTHTHTHTHTHKALTHVYAHTHTHTLTLTHIHTHTRKRTHTYRGTHARTRTHDLGERCLSPGSASPQHFA